MQVTCPGCGKGFSVGEESAGRQGKCPACGGAISIPAAKVPQAAEPAPRAAPEDECRFCGGALSRGAVFCTNCGTDLRTGQRIGPPPASSGEPSETLQVSTSLDGVLPVGLLSLFLPLAIMPYGSEARMRRDAGPWQARAWYANLGLILVTGVISAVALVAMLFREVGVLRYALWSGESFLLDQLVTSLFIHAGIAHFLGNIVFLWVFGNMLSTAIGIIRYPIAYLALGVLAGYFGHVLVHGAGVDVPCVGASGAIMGLAGAYLVLFARGDVYMAAWFRLFWLMDPWVKEFKMKGVWAVLFFIAFDVAAVVLGWTGPVAHGVHLAGFVSGLVLGFVLLLSGAVRSEGHDLLTWLSGGRWRQRGSSQAAEAEC